MVNTVKNMPWPGNVSIYQGFSEKNQGKVRFSKIEKLRPHKSYCLPSILSQTGRRGEQISIASFTTVPVFIGFIAPISF